LQGKFFIGSWLVKPAMNALEDEKGASFHLEPKVMQVLILLASTPGEVVTKERLLRTVWPGIFVSDDVLTRSISEIRRVFSDDSKAPQFIQTIPKVGYRLIAPTQREPEDEKNMTAIASVVATPTLNREALVPEPELLPATASGGISSIPGSGVNAVLAPIRPPTRSFGLRQLALWLAILAVVAAIAIIVIRSRKSNPEPSDALITLPFTSEPGSQGQPAFSSDGKEIAFVWNGPSSDNMDIYVKMIGTSTSVRLTSNPDDDLAPAWSPDDRYIAFIRRSPTECSIFLMPAIGGAERKLYTLPSTYFGEYGGLAWSKDGKNLIFPQRQSAGGPSTLVSLSLATLQVHPITFPQRMWDGDLTPAVSPDGTRIAFVRGFENSSRDIYVMDAAGGTPRRLTKDGRLVLGLTWSQDGSSLIYAANRSNGFSLWRVPASGGNPERLTVGTENSYSPAVSRQGEKLAYTHGTGTWTIARTELGTGSSKPLSRQLITSNEQDSAPCISPDGTRIAFQSWRTGAQEIWVSAADGSNPVQLTNFDGPLTGSPRWSPDGQRIAFDSRLGGYSHIYIVDVNGGVPRAVTRGDFNDVVPSWSADGKSLLFSSNRSGTDQIWRIPDSGAGPARQITTESGMFSSESPDGLWIYYTKQNVPGLWRIPAPGGQEQKVLDDPPNGYQGYWTLTRAGIFYLHRAQTGSFIEFVGFSDSRKPTQVVRLALQPTPLAGVSVSPDGRWLVSAQMPEAGSNISLVENFR